MDKSYKWIITLVVFTVFCFVGSVLKERADERNNGLEEFVPYDTANADIRDIIDYKSEAENSAEMIPVINLNTAGLKELVLLPGIGVDKAMKIVEYRNQYGGFKNIEEIKSVPDIGEGIFRKISKYLTVE